MHRRGWLQPVIAPLLPHMLARLSSGWAAILSTGRHLNGQATPEDTNPATTDEVVQERLVRELTREHLGLLCNMADKLLPGSSIGTGAGQTHSKPFSCQSPFYPNQDTTKAGHTAPCHTRTAPLHTSHPSTALVLLHIYMSCRNMQGSCATDQPLYKVVAKV